MSREEAERFRADGFAGPFRAFDAAQMAAIEDLVRTRVLAMPCRYSSYASGVRHLDSRTVFDLCAAPAILERVASLIGHDLLIWGSGFFDKPPARRDRPEEFPWHQDAYHWRLEPMLTISAWLAITEATPKNGCMEMIPGSHKQLVPPRHTSDGRYSGSFAGVTADPAHFDASGKVPIALEPGQFVLFTERTLHHSGPNRTRRRRLGLGMRFTVPFVQVSEDYPCILLSGEDRFGLNRYAEPPAGEPDESPWFGSPPLAEGLRLDRPLHGLGWHFPEHDGQRPICWSGPDTESWLDVRPPGTEAHRLRCHVPHAIHPSVLRGLRISVNGTTIEPRLAHAEDGAHVEVDVPAPVMRRDPERTRIAFRVPEVMRPCDVNPGSIDARQVGIALAAVSLEPTSRPVPTERA